MLITTNERFESEVFKHLHRIESGEPLKIYKSILAESIFLKKFDCQPAYRGETSHLDFRFLLREDNSQNCFAIKIARTLTFYFRPPAVKFYNKEKIFNDFPELKEAKGEYYLVLKDFNTWIRVLSYIKQFKA